MRRIEKRDCDFCKEQRKKISCAFRKALFGDTAGAVQNLGKFLQSNYKGWKFTMKWKKGRIMSSKVFLLVLLDILTVQIASFLGLFIRYEFSFNSIPVSDMEQVLHYTIPNTIMTLIVFAVAKMYRGVWRHASSSELVNIILGNAAASAIQVTCAYMLKLTLPRSSYLIYYFAMVIGTSCVRFSYVILNILNEKMADLTGGDKKKINVMLIGAGAAEALS